MREAQDLTPKVTIQPERILVCGMGSSAIAGELMSALCQDSKVPIVTQRSYEVPSWVNHKTLVFVCSYSGNTEETLSMFKECKIKGAKMVVITTNGKLQLEAERNGVDRSSFVLVPRGLPPRFALPFFVFPMLQVAVNLGLFKLSEGELREITESMKKESLEATAKKLAEVLRDKTVLVYAPVEYEPVCRRWCQQFNENAKRFAFYNTFPEQNHNEIMALRNPPAKLHVVLLSDPDTHKQVLKKTVITKELIKQSGVPLTELALKGNSFMVKFFTALYMGDLVSVFLAEQEGIDPIETNIIEQVKKRI
jgi:glucose/mannose-6-phosphate isomerase